MTDTQHLTPALSAHEWRQRYTDGDAHEGSIGSNDYGEVIVDFKAHGGYGSIRFDPAKVAAFANAALPDAHPLKLGRADVLALAQVTRDGRDAVPSVICYCLTCMDELPGFGSFCDRHLGDALRALRGKLAALLPPSND